MTTPNPGSDEAINQGCTCPVRKNEHGKGFGDLDQPCFWVASSCPIHGVEDGYHRHGLTVEP